MNLSYSFVDLCAGIGGIRRGMEMAGFKCVGGCENDKWACMTYEWLFGDDIMGDIRDDGVKKELCDTNFDVLCAGFPCQSFSACGGGGGFEDTRGTIFFDVADIIRMGRPKVFLLENVEGLLRHDGGKTFDVILRVLIEELEYKIVGVDSDKGVFAWDKKDLVLNARYFGVPQNRPRVFLVGFDRRRYGSVLDKIPFKMCRESDECVYKDLGDVLDDDVDDSFWLAEGYWNGLKEHKKKQRKNGNGFGYVILNENGCDGVVSNALLATGGSGKERNLVYDWKEGICGKVIRGKKTPLNCDGVRMMTPGEWAKLQGFDGYAFDDFNFPNGVSKTQQYKQLGNSVAVPVIKSIGECIVKWLKYLDYVVE